MLNYEPGNTQAGELGDDIYIFGFSRGAYTARSLCGLIRKCGILKRDCFDQAPEAMKRYRDGSHPRSPEMIDFRARFAHPMAAGQEDHDRLDIPVADQGHRAETLEQLYQYRPPGSYRMMYLGVWDTVGSMGVPDRFKLLQIFNRKYDFHDTDSSSLLSSIRHAVSIDEDRRVFGSTPVANIDRLNREWAKSAGWDVDDHSAANFVPYALRPYQQRWFPGGHGAVGGGNPELGLSSRCLRWVAEGAEWAGLHLDWGAETELGKADALANACADWQVNKDGTHRKSADRDFLGRAGGFRPRVGPAKLEEVGDFAYERWCRDTSYRPSNLTVMKGRSGPPPSSVPPPGFPLR